MRKMQQPEGQPGENAVSSHQKRQTAQVVKIHHACGHEVEHRAWGERIKWLESKPCPACIGQKPPDTSDPGPRVREVEIDLSKLPAYATEFRFFPGRKWRFDFAWLAERVALEVEGFGRHFRPKGAIADCEKYNVALVAGWRVVRCVRHPDSVRQAIWTVAVLLRTPAANPASSELLQ